MCILLVQSLAQHGNDDQSHGTADESGEELGPAESGGQSLQHGLFHDAGSQQILSQHTADQPHHDGIQGSELGGGSGNPGDDLLDDVLAGLVGQQGQENDINGVAHHDGGNGEHLGSNAQKVGKHGRNEGDGCAAGQTAHQSGYSQNGIDTGAGDQLTHGLGQGLQSNEQRQHDGGFGDPANLLVSHSFFSSFFLIRR